MIVDKIDNWKIYFKKPVFNEIFRELKNYNEKTPNGVYKKSDDFYFKVMNYKTKLESSILESHRKEIDVQLVLSGSKNIKIYDSKNVEITQPYNEESDCQFYKKINNCVTEINLRSGYMAIFFPDDIHHPQFAVENNIEKIKKIVIKINEKLFA